MQILIIEVTVGYMLKILKAGIQINLYKDEFAAIRHGNYYDFINLVGEPIPFMITYDKGIIKEEVEARKDDIDFAGLLKAGPSLMKFYENCKKIYGKINDPDLNDEDFRKLVLFEIAMRMHANNSNLLNENEQLVNVISKLAVFKNFSELEIEKLQKARKFLNKIKHNNNSNYSWADGLHEFEEGYEILTKHQMTVV